MKGIKLISLLWVFILFGCQNSETSIVERVIRDFSLPASVEDSIELPATIVHQGHNVSIEWSSSVPSAISIDGNVTRSDVDVSVTLTATFSLGNTVKEKDFTVIVLAVDSNTIIIRTYAHPGVIYKTYYVQSEASFPELSIPTHSTATFMAWCLDIDLMMPLPENTTLTENIDLYAKWSVDYYDVQVVYTGHYNQIIDQSLHFQQLNLLDSYIYQPENSDIVSIGFIGTETQDFNRHQVKQVVYVETIEKKYDIFFYQKTTVPMTFKQSFIEQDDINNVNQYGLSEDNHFFTIIQANQETQYIDLGNLPLKMDETIIEVKTGYQAVFVATSDQKIYRISLLFNTSGYHDAGIQTYDLSVFNLGDFMHFHKNAFNTYAFIVVCEQGIIELSEQNHFPFVFKIDDETDQVINVLFHQNDYYILTKKNQIYLTRNYFINPSNPVGNITNLFNLASQESVIDFIAINNYIYVITSSGNAIHYATYIENQSNLPTYNILTEYSLGLQPNEEVVFVRDNVIATNQNKLYYIILEHGLTSPSISGISQLELPLEANEYIIDDQEHDFPKNVFLTNLNQIIVYDMFNRTYRKISNVTFQEGEQIYFYHVSHEDNAFFRMLTSKQLYVGYDYNYDQSLIQTVLEELNVETLFDLILDGIFYRAYTMDGQMHIKYDYYTQEKSHFVIWGITEHLVLSKDSTIPLETVDHPLIDKSWSLSHSSLENVPTTVQQDYNIYLYEVPHAFQLNFETNAEQEIPTMIIEKETGYELPLPQATGKYFMGWYMDEALTKQFQTDLVQLGQTYTLYAAWTKDTYEIHYHNTDGNISPTLMTTGTSPILTTEVPNKVGYRFVGWFDTAGMMYRVDDEPRFSDLHLYARFEPVQLQIELIDENNEMHFIFAYYDQTLSDIQGFMYGYLAYTFALDSTYQHVLDLSYILHENQTLYVRIKPKDVAIILLEEIEITGVVDYIFIDQVLFAEYNNQLYLINQNDTGSYQGETFYIDQPLNLTERFGLTRDQIKNAISFGVYTVFILTNHQVKILDATNMTIIHYKDLILDSNEFFHTDSFQRIHLIQESLTNFIGITSKQNMYLLDLEGRITSIQNVSEVITSSRFFVAVIKDIPIAYYHQEGQWITLNLYSLEINVPYEKPILRFASSRNYFEVFDNGRILNYEYRLVNGTYQFSVREDFFSLDTEAEIIKVDAKSIYLSSGIVVTFVSSVYPQIIDLKDKLDFNETIIKVGTALGGQYVYTSKHRIIFLSGYQATLELETNEVLIDVGRNHIVTNLSIYEYNGLTQQWTIMPVLESDELIVKANPIFGLTSLNRVIDFNALDNHVPNILSFSLYEIMQIVKAPFNSIPELPYQDTIDWYADRWFDRPFEYIDSEYPIVLYPKSV